MRGLRPTSESAPHSNERILLVVYILLDYATCTVLDIEVQCRSAAALCLEELYAIIDTRGKQFRILKT